jgi:hypothetical protein
MTLTVAPDLTALADLTHEWRLVGTTHGRMTSWRGDLGVQKVQHRFRAMVADGRVVIVQSRGTETGDCIFAKMAVGRSQDEPRIPKLTTRRMQHAG